MAVYVLTPYTGRIRVSTAILVNTLVLSQYLINTLLLMDTYCSRFLLNMHAQVPGAFTFVGNLDRFA